MGVHNFSDTAEQIGLKILRKPNGGSAGGVLVREGFLVLTGMPGPALGEFCTTSIKNLAIFLP